MAHKLAEPYSGKNPVPKIATKLTSLVSPERATEAKAAQLQDSSMRADEKQTEKRAERLAKGYVMHVQDPTTGEELDIKNADEEMDLRSKGMNVLDSDFPLPDWNTYRRQVISKACSTILATAAAYTFTFISTRLFSASLFTTSLALIFPTLFTYCLLFRLQRFSQIEFESRSWHSERMRGLQAGSDIDGDGQVSEEERIKESAEWANNVLRGVWPIMNPDLFSSLVDMIEDVMQSSCPPFIDSVRIADLGMGSNAARITAVRSLPDTDKKEKSETDMHGKYNDASQDEKRSNDEMNNILSEEESLNGHHVNVELSFAYQGLPSGQSAHSKAKNIHLLVEFFLGVSSLFGMKIPVWVEVTSVVGTARARLQLISDPPFVKTTMVTLLGLPRVTISAVALHKLLPNVMDLPFISGFISSSINTAVAEYVAPKSLTMDLQKLISGDDVKKDTDAVGVLVVTMHRARGVKSMDINGKSADPYVTLTYSKLGKPLYSTRIIKGDCNPVFEETAIILVDVNTVRLQEKLSFQLWDSDRMSVDDLLGIVDVDILDLIRDRSHPHRRFAPLTHPNKGKTKGTLEYTIGYYGKVPPSQHLRTTSTADPGIPEDLRSNPEFQTKRATALNELEDAVLSTSPDPEWPSGILSVQVHEIRELGVRKEGREKSVLKSRKTRGGDKGQDDDGKEQEEAEGLPSSYCTISINDELVYQTRTKPITATPIFNAGAERFVRDWRTAHVAVAVKDSRMRENDAVLGIVMLRLSELFQSSSQLTRLYSLEQGLGYGRIRISLLFRPVEAKLPPPLMGFDTGTLKIYDLTAQVGNNAGIDLRKCEVRLKTLQSSSEDRVSRKASHEQEDGSIIWAPPENSKEDTLGDLPVRSRYSSALLMSFKDASSTGGLKRTGRKALAVLWLREIVDNHDTTISIPLWNAPDGDYSRLKMNYVPPDGNLEAWDADREKVRQVGEVRLRVVFKPGIGERHQELMDGGGARKREAWETFRREKEGGLREDIGEMGGVESSEDTWGPLSGSEESMVKHQPTNESSTTLNMDHLAQSGIYAEGNDLTKPSPTPETTHTGQGTNTEVSTEAVEDESINHPSADVDSNSHEETSDSDSEGHETDSTKGKKGGVVRRLKRWKDHEKQLHREHKGVMQFKPARTMEWVKDNVEEGAHAVKERFSMRTRKPEVETEV